jgi:phytol kinase
LFHFFPPSFPIFRFLLYRLCEVFLTIAMGVSLVSFIQNVVALVAMFGYVKLVITACDAAVTKKWLSSDLSRKLVHIAAGSSVLFWPLFDEGDWSYVLNTGVAVVMSAQFIAKGLIWADPTDPVVRSISRSGRPEELLRGPLMFTGCMFVCGLFLFKHPCGVVAISALGWGDGIAPYAGKLFGRHFYQTYGRRKSVEGSAAMLLFSFAGSFLALSVVFGMDMVVGKVGVLLVVSVAATIAEAYSPADLDNVFIPMSTALIWLVLG